MGRMLVFLVVSLGILFSMANISINNSNASMVDNSIIQYETAQAKNLAASGINLAVKYLASDSTWSGKNSIKMSGGYCKIAVQNTTSQFFNGPDMGLTSAKQILSVATVNDVKDTIKAVVELPIAAVTNVVPPFLNYAVASGNSLNMHGNIKIVDDNNAQLNANVHTNGEFNMDGNYNLIKGFVTYHGNLNVHPSKSLNKDIVPNQNPKNQPNCSKMDTLLTIPSFDADSYKYLANKTYQNLTLTGNMTFGTQDKPEIIYVSGTLDLKNCTINGYVAFVVKSNILFDGNVKIGSEDPNVSSIALYTNSDLNINGNSEEIHAQIFTGGNANLNGGSTIYGSIVTGGSIQFNGNGNKTSIYYKPPNVNLTKPFWNTKSVGSSLNHPKLLSYYDNLNNGSYNYK